MYIGYYFKAIRIYAINIEAVTKQAITTMGMQDSRCKIDNVVTL